jgi:hypothetical protein
VIPSRKRIKNGHPAAIRLDYPLFRGRAAHFLFCARPIAITLEVGHVPTGTDHCVQPGKTKNASKKISSFFLTRVGKIGGWGES